MPVKKKRKTKSTYTRKRQTGKSNTKVDKSKKAKSPGKRKSASKKTYYEYRKNRSDKPGFLTGAYTAHNNRILRAGQELHKLDKEISELNQDVKHAKTREAKAALRVIIRVRKKQFRDLKKYLNSLARIKIKM